MRKSVLTNYFYIMAFPFSNVHNVNSSLPGIFWGDIPPESVNPPQKIKRSDNFPEHKTLTLI